jgi:hypothetical protein
VTETARKSSCLISCSHAAPDGGFLAFIGRQGATKLERMALDRPAARNLQIRDARNQYGGLWCRNVCSFR